MKINFLNSLSIFFLLLFCNSLEGQSNLQLAKTQIKEMKEGFILVRLKTDSLKIASLENNGYAKEAEKVKLDLYKENKEILLSFAKTFDFCPVYFFYSNHSKEIQSGDIKGKIFDYNLKLVEQEQITGKTHFVAEFGKTENLGIHGLILMDSFFIPLKSPFPFYQRQYTFFSLVKLSKARVAKKLNKRLHDQYEIWTNPRWGF